MKKCPYCAEDIQEEAIKCRFCGEMLDGSSRAGTASAPPQKVSPPMAGQPKKSVGPAGCAIVAVGLLLWIVYLVNQGPNPPSPSPPSPSVSPATSAPSLSERVEITQFSGSRAHGYATFVGRAKNIGDVPLEYVQVAVDLLDSQGRVVDTDWAFVNSAATLFPGDEVTFKLMASEPQNWSGQYKYYVKEARPSS